MEDEMKIKQIFAAVILASVLSIGEFGQSVSGRVTGIAVDPSDPSGVIGIVITTVLTVMR
jgi:hypothetical protein